MSGINSSNQPIVSQRTVKRIRCGVIAGHLLTVLLVLAFSVVSEWLDKPEETITIQFYDPKLDNIVENPSPDPDPANPIPPSGTQDGAETPAPAPQVDPAPAPPEILAPEPVKAVQQPRITKRTRPKPAVNKTLPNPIAQPRARAVKQPKVTNRKLPRSLRQADRSAQRTAQNNSNSSARAASRGPRGSNPVPGHTAPGGQRGNSGYDIQVAIMIKRMWITPDINRLGGREPRVNIRLEIASDGRVISKRITRRSGVLAMDESIQALLDNLYRVVRPYDGKPHTIEFSLKAE
ncbi:MAG: TonB C-terminal domain-containing protein [Lentisphaeria bacterium]|nr:TonB C-terminal domain-containing protein [Lentisphaeria bacterium]